MSESEYKTFLEYFIPDYAAEIAANYELSSGDAEAQAKREMQDSLPEGLNTSGQVLLSIVSPSPGGDVIVGSLWYKPDFIAGSAFIFDFHILPSRRGAGLGTEALAVLENRLARDGLKQIKLRVAADNARAKHLYDTGGFRTTGINMMKMIGIVH